MEGVARRQFFVVFDDGGRGFCFDKPSCQTYASAPPPTPPTLFLRGVLSPYPEENPNFYKSSSVYVPACSGDLFVGNRSAADADGFWHHGARTVVAIVAELLHRQYPAELFPEAGPLRQADDVVLVGGAGVVALARFLRPMLPSSVRLVTVCDGCLLPTTPALAPRPCTSSQDCDPSTALARGAPLWQPWGGLTAADLGASAVLAAASSPLLVQMPQADAALLQALGAWPLSNSTRRAYAVALATQLRALAVAHTNTTFLPAGCVAERAPLALSAGFFRTQAACRNGYNFTFPFSFAQAMGVVVNRADQGGSLACAPAANASTFSSPCQV